MASCEPTHPGDFLVSTVLPDLGVTMRQAAEDLGVSRQALYRVVGRRTPLSADLAIRLEEYTGLRAELWMFLQVSFDLWDTRSRRAPGTVRKLAVG